jgi:hypothetical protein
MPGLRPEKAVTNPRARSLPTLLPRIRERDGTTGKRKLDLSLYRLRLESRRRRRTRRLALSLKVRGRAHLGFPGRKRVSFPSAGAGLRPGREAP